MKRKRNNFNLLFPDTKKTRELVGCNCSYNGHALLRLGLCSYLRDYGLFQKSNCFPTCKFSPREYIFCMEKVREKKKKIDCSSLDGEFEKCRTIYREILLHSKKNIRYDIWFLLYIFRSRFIEYANTKCRNVIRTNSKHNKYTLLVIKKLWIPQDSRAQFFSRVSIFTSGWNRDQHCSRLCV